MSLCKGCSREISWVVTEKGEKMPIDNKKITIITIEGKVVSGYTSHFATCPKSYEFRNRKGKKS